MDILVLVVLYTYIFKVLFWRKEQKTTQTNYTPKGHSYYSKKVFLNISFGLIGMLLFNLLIRDKGIIPVWSYWVGFVGFAIIWSTGIYYLYLMIAKK
jgi:uncharacterized membrane protein